MNMAMTLDGKVSTIDRTGAVFTSHHDKQRMAQIRARADALIMGATTVAIDTPRMLINTPELRQSRTQHGKPEQPIRVILSATGSLRPDARPFSSNASPILVFASNSTSKEWRTSIETAVRPSNGRLFIMGEDRVPLRTMLEILYSEYQVRSAVCEGGPHSTSSCSKKNWSTSSTSPSLRSSSVAPRPRPPSTAPAFLKTSPATPP